MDQNEKRMRILKAIEHDAKVDLKELSVRLDIPETEIVNEMSLMEQEGLICGYLTLIDWDRTDSQTVTALIEVRCTPQRGQGFDTIAERIYKYPEVNSVYLISGGFDLLFTMEGKTLKEISTIVRDKLSVQESILSCATHFILQKYKDHGTILSRKFEDERMPITL